MKEHTTKRLSLALAVVMLLGLTACAQPAAQSTPAPTASLAPVQSAAPVSEPPAEGIYTPGTFEAAAQGMNGMVALSVEFSADAITNITIGDHRESPGISDPAIEQLPQLIVRHQSLGVDTVTGATVTSNAILSAVADAVGQAGGDADALRQVPVTAAAGEAVSMTADVVVVGGGGAGLSAAVSVVQAGKSVILMEKTAALGGNTLASGGGSTTWNAVIPEKFSVIDSMPGQADTLATYLDLPESELPDGYRETLVTLKGQIKEYLAGDTSKMFDSIELHIMQTYYGGLRQDLDGNWIYGEYAFVKMLCEESPNTVAWMESLGTRFNPGVAEPIGSMWRRAQAPATNNYTDLFEAPFGALTAGGGEVVYNAKAEKLIVENGTVVGVSGTMTDGVPIEIRAGAVVLTTGGFANNTEMVIDYNRYWETISPDIGTTNVSSTRGEGIVMALEAGAALVGMEFTQLMPIGWKDSGQLALGAGNNVMYVGPDGKRFVNEYAERDVISKAAFAVGGTFYEIKSQDQDIAGQLGRVNDGTNMVFAADTLEELAAMINVPADGLIAEVERYNGFVDAASDPDFGKGVFSASISAPYMARVLSPSTHHTMGGVRINIDGQVLNDSGTPIAGLYAAGEVTGGIHAGNRLGGNAIADAFTFGRRAGNSAAAYVG